MDFQLMNVKSTVSKRHDILPSSNEYTECYAHHSTMLAMSKTWFRLQFWHPPPPPPTLSPFKHDFVFMKKVKIIPLHYLSNQHWKFDYKFSSHSLNVLCITYILLTFCQAQVTVLNRPLHMQTTDMELWHSLCHIPLPTNYRIRSCALTLSLCCDSQYTYYKIRLCVKHQFLSLCQVSLYANYTIKTCALTLPRCPGSIPANYRIRSCCALTFPLCQVWLYANYRSCPPTFPLCQTDYTLLN